jgi:hypothetical protein
LTCVSRLGLILFPSSLHCPVNHISVTFHPSLIQYGHSISELCFIGFLRWRSNIDFFP